MSRVTLAQWRMLAAVVDHGGFARAAQAIHKSPSTLNHAVHKLEEQLGVKVFEPEGRQVRLTEAGQLLLRRARQLLDEVDALEDVAAQLREGEEAEVVLCVDQIFPSSALAWAMEAFSVSYPHVRLQLHETVLNGGVEMLVAGQADLLVSGFAAAGHLGEPLVMVRFIAVAHPDHPLHALDRQLNLRDLKHYRQIVVRDSAQGKGRDAGWLEAEQRWTVSHISTSLDMIERNLGFAWLPETRIRRHLDDGRLLPLPLEAGGVREAPMLLIHQDLDRAGPATRAMASLLRESVSTCPAESQLDHR
uniref:LysR family transcriptional regulator n=1 Tax=Halomonas sp. TaxID=1486246 RepID=UPI00260B6A3C|nr:LysR family transcriptional regulator [Halomonas sp.]